MKSPADALAATAADLLLTREKLAQLAAERNALFGSDDFSMADARRLDGLIGDQERLVIAFEKRIGILQERVVAEQQKQRQAEFAKAVSAFEATLPARFAAAWKLQKAITAVAVAYRECDAATTACVNAWPEGAVIWTSIGQHGGNLIEDCFCPPALVHHVGDKVGRHPTPDEFAAMASMADETVVGFADTEQRHHAELVKDLREQGVPSPESEAA
jgi:hypothetical protein